MYIHSKYICISLVAMFPSKFHGNNRTIARLYFILFYKKFRLVVYCFLSKILKKK